MNSVRIADIVQFRRGVSWSASQEHHEPGPGRIPVLRIPNIQERLTTSDLVYLSGITDGARGRAAASRGWILAVGSNGNPERIGNAVLIEDETDFLFASFLVGINCDRSRVVDRYLLRLLHSEEIRSHLRVTIRGSTGLQNINLPALGDFRIDLPAMPVQERIAEILDAVDIQIRLTSRVIAKLEQAGRGLMEDLLSRGVDFNGRLRLAGSFETQTGDAGSFPASWTVVRLGQIAEVERGKFGHRPRNDPMYLNGPFPFIQTGDIAAVEDGVILDASQSLSYLGAAVSRRFAAGTIAVTIAANIADTALLGRPMYFPDSVVGVSVREPHRAEYVQFVLRAAKPRLEARAPQSAQRNINLQDLRPLEVPLPDPAEQSRICQVMDAHAKLIAVERDALAKLLMKKAALLADLLSGRVRVPIEAAS